VADKMPDRPSEEHPIIAGLVALVGVGLVVGLVIGLVVLAGTKVLGIGGDDGDSTANEQASLYLPTPSKTTADTDPEITLAPGETESASEDPSESPSETPEREITLSASAVDVGPMEQFQLTGVYPEGEGAILTVQRFQDGSWVDFPATGSVSGEAFQIAVQTSKSGVNRFRVVDTDSGLKSGEVRVTVAG
jgi:septal ring-binding cell division protein DamX